MAKRKTADAPVATRIATFIGSNAGKLANRKDALTAQVAQATESVSDAGARMGGTIGQVATDAAKTQRSAKKAVRKTVKQATRAVSKARASATKKVATAKKSLTRGVARAKKAFKR